MKNYLKEDHSPLDTAVFAVLNSTIMGLVFSLSMFNKNYESSKFNLKKKIGFTGRSILVINTMHGFNQFLLKWFKIRKNQNYMKYKLGIKNQDTINLISSFCSNFIPALVASKIYFYKNNYLLVGKKFFIGVGTLFFMFDYFLMNSNNKI